MLDYTKQQAHILKATPALVDWLLSLNTHNRAIKKSVVEYLQHDINRGNFILTNQGIGITKTGWLNDGQHRLTAIKESGYPAVDLLIVTGLDDAAQTVVDKGAKRSQADILKLMLNKTVSGQLIAVVNVLLKIKPGLDGSFTYNRTKTFESDIAEFIAEHEVELTLIMEVVGNMRAPVTAALVEYAIRYDLYAAIELAEKIKTGVELSSTHPAYKLRCWLDKNKAASASTQIPAYSVTVTACVAHALDNPISSLRTSGSWDKLPKKMHKAA